MKSRTYNHHFSPFSFPRVGWIQYWYVIVFERFRFSPSTRRKENGVFKKFHSGERFHRKFRFRWPFSSDSWLATTWQGGHVGGQNNKKNRSIGIKKFSSQWRKTFCSCPPAWLPWRQLQTSNTCGRKAYPQRESCVFKRKRIRVDGP